MVTQRKPFDEPKRFTKCKSFHFAERVTVDKKIITFRKREKSPMPEDVITKLSPKELRDLVAFLASQKLKK